MCTLYNFSKTRLFQTDVNDGNVKCYLDLKREVLHNHDSGKVCLNMYHCNVQYTCKAPDERQASTHIY